MESTAPCAPSKAWGGPRFIRSAGGAFLYDVDGNRYLDYVGSWGVMLLGHAHPAVSRALLDAVEAGTSYGAPTEGEVLLAETLVARVPGLEVVRLVSSGTEATMSALRLARAATGRDRVVKFRGGYHGHADSFLVEAGSGAATLGTPSSPGVTAGAASDTLVADYNDLAGVEALFSAHRGRSRPSSSSPSRATWGASLPSTASSQASGPCATSTVRSWSSTKS